MRRTLVIVTAVGVSLPLAALPAGAGEPAKRRGDPLVPDAADRISGLVLQLGDPEWTVRHQATEDLKAFGEPAVPFLVEAYRQCDDHEARLRIKEVVHQIFMQARLSQDGAFLGVKQRWTTDKHLPDGQGGVLIAAVLPHTSAERAGLKDGDILLRVNDRSLAAFQGRDGFAQLIGGHEPGTDIELCVFRNGEQMKIKVRLGARPFRYAEPEVKQRLQHAFAEMWSERFEESSATAAREDRPTH